MTDNHYNCIYKLTSPSGRIYIGQTNDFNRRMHEHEIFKDAKESKIRKAIAKYGWDKFTVEILVEDVESQDKLDQLEIQYIAEYNSIEEGYNIVAGGCGAKRPDGHNINYGTGRFGLTIFDPEYQKVSKKAYYEDNKDLLLKRNKQYREINKDAINAQRKVYRDTHKEQRNEWIKAHLDEINAKRRETRNKNKDAINAKRRDEYQLNKDDILSRNKKWRENNKDKLSDSAKRYREEHKEELKEKKHEYYLNNKERHSEKDKQYREEHKDELKEYHREYFQRNKDKIYERKKEYDKKYRDENRDRLNAIRRMNRAKKKAIEKNNGQMELNIFTK